MIALHQPHTDGIPVPLQVAVTFDPMKYHVATPEGRFDPMDEKNVVRRLRAVGVSQKVPKGADISPVESCLLAYQLHNKADGFGRLSGHSSGLHEQGGKRFLVVEGSRPTVAVPGEWPVVDALLTAQFGMEQMPYLIGWLQQARRSFRSFAPLPGQVAIFAGPHGVGKSLLQNAVITPLLGGRQACPFDYMAGKCDFNSEIFEADHLAVEDKFFRFDMDTRRQFGTRLKELAVNSIQRCHGKGQRAIFLTPKWRVSLSLNPEKENLNVLPPMDDAIKEKLHLFSLSMPEFPFSDGATEKREAFGAAIAAELPAFAHFVDTYEVPNDLRHERYGVKSWHCPALLDAVEDTAPEVSLLACLLHDLPTLGLPDPTAWSGDATDLERLMTASAMPSAMIVRRLLSWPGAMGTYLGRLAKTKPKVVKRKRVKGTSQWHITFPPLPV